MLAECTDTFCFTSSSYDVATERNNRHMIAGHGGLDNFDPTVVVIRYVDAVKFVVATSWLLDDRHHTSSINDLIVRQLVVNFITVSTVGCRISSRLK